MFYNAAVCLFRSADFSKGRMPEAFGCQSCVSLSINKPESGKSFQHLLQEDINQIQLLAPT